MTEKKQVLFMQHAYGLLFELEITLRKLIEKTMIKVYGQGWIIEAPMKNKHRLYNKEFSSFYLHELISMIMAYDTLSVMFNSEEIIKLQRIISIRNKIAHSIIISDTEFEQLLKALDIIKKIYNDSTK